MAALLQNKNISTDEGDAKIDYFKLFVKRKDDRNN